MGSESSISKRIKRHVVGRIRPYFAATAPGFESICLRELRSLALPIENASAVPGGVEFYGRLVDCYQANLSLRTANRILMRIASFKATSFRQIGIKAAEIPWELYLPSGLSPQISVKTQHCRLYHTDAIAERILKKIPQNKQNASPSDQSEGSFEQTIFIRGVHDRFTVSIDSSGSHLHKRGLKKHPGKAPLRETTAAAALLLAGYSGNIPLVDPMCGTGTFSLEAAMMARNIPAGWFRKFAFMGWPSFRRAQWEYQKRQLKINFGSNQAPIIFASDKDPSACRHLEGCLQQHQLSGVIQIFQHDFFNIRPKDLTDQTGLVAINPPYGHRLQNRQKSDQLFLKVCTHLKREYRGWKLILISPNKSLAQKVPFKLTSHKFSHGGLKPVMMIGKI